MAMIGNRQLEIWSGGETPSRGIGDSGKDKETAQSALAIVELYWF